MVLGWAKRGKLVRASLWECSYKRLKLAQQFWANLASRSDTPTRGAGTLDREELVSVGLTIGKHLSEVRCVWSIGAIFRELEWKTPIFSWRAALKTPNAS